MNDAPARLAPRPPDSHKGDFGRAVLIGGSRGMAGAIALSGMAALRGGAGLVRLAVPDGCVEVVASFEPSYMTLALPHDVDGRIAATARTLLVPHLTGATAVACGPGLGQSDDLRRLVEWLYTTVPSPVVLDADALNLLAQRSTPLAEAGGPRILTPHPGEFQRLAGGGKLSRAQAEQRAAEFAKEYQVVLLLKGRQTYVTDGSRHYHNTTGNPGMATGGAGDVLTGLTTALLCQNLPPLEAAMLAAHVHGRAGDLAAADLGQVGMIASDLVKYLPAALREVS